MDRLQEASQQRWEVRTYQKQASIAMSRIGDKTTSLGFVGKSLIGFGPNGEHMGMDQFNKSDHFNPASYTTNKQQHTSDGAEG